MKLLVVDDDRYVREGILSSLALEELGIHHVMQTHDGKTALEITRWFSPDIIITDICMPRMDGMAFAAAVRKTNPECLLIFITGFAEIGYLKQAIDLAAVAFVEKPLQPDELLRAVKNAIDRHQERQRVHQSKANLLKLSRQQTAAMMMRSHKDMSQLQMLCERINFPQKAIYRCLAMQVKQMPHEVMAAVEMLAEEQGFDCVCELREDRQIHAVLAYKRRQKPKADEFGRLLVKKLPEIVVSEGMSVAALDKVHESRKTACLMLEGAFYDTQRRLFPYEQLGGGNVLTMDAYAHFVRLLDENMERLPAWLDNLLAAVIDKRTDRVDSVRSLVLSMLRELYRRKPELYGKVYGITKSSELEDYVASVSSAQQYREMLSTLFEQMNELEDTNSRFAQVVRDAKIFIAEHIHEPMLGLKEIAAQVNFSAAYLNIVFRTETGMTIKQYLIDSRIREAKRLLKDPSVRIAEIAQRCGYSNSNYFAKAFKEATGMTPGEYRERKA